MARRPARPTGDEAYERAMRRAIRLLRHRDRTRAELRERLGAAGVDDGVIARVLAKLGVLADDRRTAANMAQGLRARGPIATPMVRAVIEGRGVPAPIAGEAAGSDRGDATAARDLARQASARTRGLPAATRWRRVLAALARKGFDEETSLDAARRVLGEPPDRHDSGDPE